MRLKIKNAPNTRTGPAGPKGQMASPEAGAAVMATGIVSVALHTAGQKAISLALLAIAAVLWLLLGAGFVWRLRDQERWGGDASRPAALTAVAGTAVLGARLTLLGWSWAGWMLLATAAILLIALSGATAPAAFAYRTGAGFLLVVAPQSLAVLAALLGTRSDAAWSALAALAPFALGLLLYLPLAIRFDVGQLRSGAGDQWVSGGALAISTLACAQISQALLHAHSASWLVQPLRVGALVLWAIAIAWLAPLVLAELRWRRPHYDVRRWATVFPLGMYAVMSDTAGTAGRAHGLVTFGHVWAWVALAGWLAVALGCCGAQLARGGSR